MEDEARKLLDFLCCDAAHACTLDTELRDHVLIDSLKNLELIMFLEREFGVAVTRKDVLHHFDTPRSILEMVRRRQSGR